MNLHNLREDLQAALKASELSQVEFAARYGLSYSWVNKFLNGAADNPRLSSLTQLEAAIQLVKQGRSPSESAQPHERAN